VEPNPTSGLNPAAMAKVEASGIRAMAEARPANKFWAWMRRTLEVLNALLFFLFRFEV
jgi:hypothetical protein